MRWQLGRRTLSFIAAFIVLSTRQAQIRAIERSSASAYSLGSLRSTGGRRASGSIKTGCLPYTDLRSAQRLSVYHTAQTSVWLHIFHACKQL